LRHIIALAAALVLLAPVAASAQRAGQRPAQPEKAEPPPAEPQVPAPEQTPPYEVELTRLSEVLGAVHYLRGICGDRNSANWRDDMSALIESEAPGPERRSRLVASFNRGYRGVAETHRRCTPTARVLIDRYLDEGARLARDIAARYGS
jgi:uncharacterized protein (TIGR02301 family)